mmetsp:Transcript_2971/g.4341  ORF Transcript_2971/g.4341 Transcript_2971/m.4341 type:complete len:217 (-) Transcript_2971:56-706(-)
MKIVIRTLLCYWLFMIGLCLTTSYTVLAADRVDYPSIPPHRTFKQLMKEYNGKQLLQILKDRNAKCHGCRKKSEFARYIADHAQFLPEMKDAPTTVKNEVKEAKKYAEKWQKDNEERAEIDTVMGLFKDKEDSKKKLISKKVIRDLQRQGIDTSHLKYVNPWDSFPGNKPKGPEVEPINYDIADDLDDDDGYGDEEDDEEEKKETMKTNSKGSRDL